MSTRISGTLSEATFFKP